MRNVIYAINITLDGCCDHTKTIADEEMLEYYTPLLGDVDLLVFGLFGRKTATLLRSDSRIEPVSSLVSL